MYICAEFIIEAKKAKSKTGHTGSLVRHKIRQRRTSTIIKSISKN